MIWSADAVEIVGKLEARSLLIALVFCPPATLRCRKPSASTLSGVVAIVRDDSELELVILADEVCTLEGSDFTFGVTVVEVPLLLLLPPGSFW